MSSCYKSVWWQVSVTRICDKCLWQEYVYKFQWQEWLINVCDKSEEEHLWQECVTNVCDKSMWQECVLSVCDWSV